MVDADQVGRVLVVDSLLWKLDEIGHLADDDVFLSQCIAGGGFDFEIKTSPASAKNVVSKLDVVASEFREFGWLSRIPRLQQVARLLSAKIHDDVTDVVFAAFEELPTLLFMLRHPKVRVHLIFHNNLSLEREQAHPKLYPMLLRAVQRRAASLMVSSSHQVNLLKQIYPDVDDSKIVVKPHHNLGYERERPPLPSRQNTILFMGPANIRKPVAPLIELISADTEGKYRYVLRRMFGVTDEQRRFFVEHPNVDFSTEYMNDEEYYSTIRESQMLMSTHSLLFEGKLSGPISDAIASGTPVLCRRMAPHDEMFESFGDLGYMVDYESGTWADEFLATDHIENVPGIESNMASCREASSMESIREIFTDRFTEAR